MDKFNPANCLFHYTTVDNAIKILRSNQLKFGELKYLNDIYEAYREVYAGEDSPLLAQELSKYRQISLCQDFKIPAMWGHYASSGKGVCIALNAKTIVERLNLSASCGLISYQDDYMGYILKDNTLEVPEWIEENKSELFFIKSSDWSYEKEYRIIERFDSDKWEFLDISGCVEAIIMCYTDTLAIRNCSWNLIKKIPECQDKLLELGAFFDSVNLRDENGHQIWSQKREEIDIESLNNY